MKKTVFFGLSISLFFSLISLTGCDRLKRWFHQDTSPLEYTRVVVYKGTPKNEVEFVSVPEITEANKSTVECFAYIPPDENTRWKLPWIEDELHTKHYCEVLAGSVKLWSKDTSNNYENPALHDSSRSTVTDRQYNYIIFVKIAEPTNTTNAANNIDTLIYGKTTASSR